MADGTIAITANDIVSNRATRAEEYFGGGGAFVRANLPISGNAFLNNDANGDGGGLFLHSNSSVLTFNLVRGNEAAGDRSPSTPPLTIPFPSTTITGLKKTVLIRKSRLP